MVKLVLLICMVRTHLHPQKQSDTWENLSALALSLAAPSALCKRHHLHSGGVCHWKHRPQSFSFPLLTSRVARGPRGTPGDTHPIPSLQLWKNQASFFPLCVLVLLKLDLLRCRVINMSPLLEKRHFSQSADLTLQLHGRDKHYIFHTQPAPNPDSGL